MGRIRPLIHERIADYPFFHPDFQGQPAEFLATTQIFTKLARPCRIETGSLPCRGWRKHLLL